MSGSTTNLGLTLYDDVDDPTVKAWRDTINRNDALSAFKKIDNFAGPLKTSTLASLNAAPTSGQVLVGNASGSAVWADKAPDADKLDGVDSSLYARQNAAPVGDKVLTSVAGTPTWAAPDGWTPVSDSWAYASASTVTVPSGAAVIYSVGDKLRLTNSSVKYFYIVGVADTVLTITGGSDYTLVSAAISSISYSHAASPVGFPQWFNATPPTFDTATFDNGSGGQPTTIDYRFTINGRALNAHFKGSGVKAGTGNYMNFAHNLLAPANYTTYNSVGSVWMAGFIGTVIVAAMPYLEFQNSIPDNTTIAHISFSITYEI